MSIDELNNPFNRYTLLMASNTSLITWLQSNGLLRHNVTCTTCSMPCKLTHRARNIDKFSWRCPGSHESSVRLHSIFSNSHLFIQDILHFMFNHIEGHNLYKCADMCGVNYKTTAVEWVKKLRDLYCEFYVRKIRPVKFGGIVEIDESLFGKRVKYNKGNPRGLKIWIFGLVERQTNRLKLFPVEKRDKATLLKLIVDNVEHGSTIYSDGWRAYNTLNDMGFRHLVVEHKHAFKTMYIVEFTE